MLHCTTTAMGCLLGLDPGHSKCGLVCTDAGQQRLDLCLVCSPRECWDRLQQLWQERQPACLYIGNGGTSARWLNALQAWWPAERIHLVPEVNSTLEARSRYWQLHPRTGWRRWWPEGLQVPPRAVDDLAALVILERGTGCRFTPAPAPGEAP